MGTAGCRSQSRVIRAASTPEIEEAEKHVKLVQWAAKKAADEGMPQAAMMQAKAEQAVLALEALKEEATGEALTPAPVGPETVETIQRTVKADPVMVEEIAELEKQVKLLTWAAKTAAAKGMPQAPAAQVRADEAVQKLMQLKEQQEAQQGGRSVTTVPVSPAPAPPAPVAPAAPAAVTGVVSKEQVAEAEKRASLAVWAAKKTAEEGMPQASMMQAKADAAVQELAALKEALEQQEAAKPVAAPVPPVAAPVPSAPVAPKVPSSAPSHAELEEVKKQMRLLLWAAKTAEEQNMPQADMMKGKADAKVQEYEQMMQLVEAR